MATCTHLDSGRIARLPEDVAGCEDCLAVGSTWAHLRLCLACGRVGCCDSSPMRHASAHARRERHPLVRSVEPGEVWSWCYVDQIAMIVPEVQGEMHIPPSTPG